VLIKHRADKHGASGSIRLFNIEKNRKDGTQTARQNYSTGLTGLQ